MPDKPLTVAAYAAGASLAAATLIYVFAPTYFLDGDVPNGARRTGAVGLYNPANDCFINAVLQSLAGLGELRLYLIRESHRRSLDGPEVYRVDQSEEAAGNAVSVAKLEGLQGGIVTSALKEVLDSLNERPLYRKTVSAAAFVAALERAFRQRINRQQQDAQEFLQLLAERLCEEYHAGQGARRRATMRVSRHGQVDGAVAELPSSPGRDEDPVEESAGSPAEDVEPDATEDGFPFEGRLESQLECLSCHFQPKPSVSSFVTLTLHVPQQSSTTLNQCFDGLLRTEHIDGFKCERCRLQHAVELRSQELARTRSSDERDRLQSDIVRLQDAIRADPEKPPDGVALPDIKHAPKRRIARHVRIAAFPKVIAIHLSRSIFDRGSVSMKNSAKVAFPELLPLGGILDRRKYKLLGVVTHKGNHNSGHYESFRRQIVAPPFSTPSLVQPLGAYGAPSGSPIPNPSLNSNPSVQQSPLLEPGQCGQGATSGLSTAARARPTSSASNLSGSAVDETVSADAHVVSSDTHREPSSASTTSRLSSTDAVTSAATSVPGAQILSSPQNLKAQSTPRTERSRPSSKRIKHKSSRSSFLGESHSQRVSSSIHRGSSHRSTADTGGSGSGSGNGNGGRDGSTTRKKNETHRWWRISDDKVKESKKAEVLGMQREVYLLFYEMVK
ncbi:MAG: hypothetical protein M1815_000718 [Lichina confinis]|nr:MAG: hypothetical protein M1815_000718 [Lichina confinis]